MAGLIDGLAIGLCETNTGLYWESGLGSAGFVNPDGGNAAKTLVQTLGDTYGMGIVFNTDQSMYIHDAGTPANNYSSAGTVSNGALVGPGGKLTYASPSAKLCLQSTGLYAYGAHNLLTYSSTFSNSAWSKNACAVTAAQTTGPYGLTDGWKVLASAGTNTFNLFGTGQTETAATYVYTFIVKYGNAQWLWFRSGKASTWAAFDVLNGVVGNTYGANLLISSIQSLGSGWYKCSFVAVGGNAANQNTVLTFGSGSTPTDGGVVQAGTEYCYLYGASSANYPAVTDYIATTSSALYSLPYEYAVGGATCNGVLVEEARTNLLTYSNTFSNAAWTKQTCTPTDNSATGPDGTTSASLWSFTGNGYVQQQVTAASGSAYTASGYFKAGTASFVRMSIFDGSHHETWFNLSTVAVATNASGNTSVITSVGNGWYRCSISRTTAGANPYWSSYFCATDGAISANGNTGYAYISGFELGSTASSPILTGSASVTRAADVPSMAQSLFPMNGSGNQTFYVKVAAINDIISGSRLIAFTDPVTPLFIQSATDVRGFNGGTTTSATLGTGSFANTTPTKAASAFDGSNISICGNAGTVTTAAQAYTFVGNMNIGTNPGNGNAVLNGYIQQVLALPRKVSNAELVTLTT